MKSKFLILLPVLIMVMLFSPLAQAQTSNYADPNGVPQYLWYSQTPSDNSVYRGKIDTLSEVPLGGAQNLSCLITCSDTMKATLYFDYKELGRTTWTAGYTDSIIAEKDTIIEIPIRTSTLNRLPIFSGKYRLRVSQHSTATPSDYDSSSTYTQKWIWKP